MFDLPNYNFPLLNTIFKLELATLKLWQQWDSSFGTNIQTARYLETVLLAVKVNLMACIIQIFFLLRKRIHVTREEHISDATSWEEFDHSITLAL